MKKINVLLLLLTAIFSQYSNAHGGSEHSHSTREQVAWEKIKDGALIIDTRTTKEYTEKSLTNAINIPYQNIVAAFKSRQIPKDRSVVFYDRSGNRSAKALLSLRVHGYTNLHNGGGLEALLTAKP